MRAPTRRRPPRRRILPTAPREALGDLARHAIVASTGDQGREPLGDSLEPVDAGEQLGAAFERGQVSGPWQDGFPRYVWLREGDTAVEFRLTGQAAGTYTGYRLPPSYWPEGLS